jgi:hypothetical protein
MPESDLRDEAVPAERATAGPMSAPQPALDLAGLQAALASSAGDGVAGRLDSAAVLGLQRVAGNRATARLAAKHMARGGRAARRVLARLGYRIGSPLPSGAPTPLKDLKDQRQWNKTDFHSFWEQEQGRKLTDSEKKTIDRGCIGITANNLEGGGNPSLKEVYDDFSTALAAVQKYNSSLWNTYVSSSKYVLFGMLFWSNQNPDREKRWDPDPTAFRGDPSTHRVDMSEFKNRSQPTKVNYDYGFWDPSTASFWHANHKENGPDDPMIVYQSTKEKFARRIVLANGDIRYGYDDFDRVVYGVAVANNYNADKARALNPTTAPTPAPAAGAAPPSPPPPG